jgi:hypothetical protein
MLFEKSPGSENISPMISEYFDCGCGSLNPIQPIWKAGYDKGHFNAVGAFLHKELTAPHKVTSTVWISPIQDLAAQPPPTLLPTWED